MSRDQIHGNFPKLSTSPEGSWMCWVPSTEAPLSIVLALIKSHVYQDTMLNLGFSELGTVRSFQVTPREAETNLCYKIPQTSYMPQPEIGGPLSPLLFHWVWWELSLSYSLHLLYTPNYRKILIWVLQAGFSLCKWNILEQIKLSSLAFRTAVCCGFKKKWNLRLSVE